MDAREEAERVRKLSDPELLAGFVYCTERLGMSEDEAYRRIEVTRLGRHFPLLLERLASGRISLSVAALLKPHLTHLDHVALLDAVAGLTIKQAREVLAAWFPRPDVLPCIRKLPRQRAGAAGSDRNARSATPSGERGSDEMAQGCSASASAFGPARAGGEGTPRVSIERAGPHVAKPLGGIDAAGSAASGRLTLFREKAPDIQRAVADRPAPLTRAPAPTRANRTSSKIEPLSPERYKVVFTADADLKRKLDLARDLLRHAVPQGDLATIIGRALDLLLEKTLQRRFARTGRRGSHSPAKAANGTSAERVTTSTAPSTAERAYSERIHSERVDSERVDSERIDSVDDVSAMSAPDASTDGAANRSMPSVESDKATAKPTHLDDEPSRTASNDGERVMSPRPTTAHAAAADDARSPPSATPQPDPEPLPQPRSSRHLPNATRRAVLERDGLRCTWVSPDGVRCESCAWLEHDHVVPRSFGGGDAPCNVRILCRAHNRLAAEQAYGQPAIARIITRRRARKDPGHIADVSAGRKPA